MKNRIWILTCLAAIGCSSSHRDGASAAASLEFPSHEFKVETVVDRSAVVWGFDFLPDGRIVFTEKPGMMVVFIPTNGQVQSLQGLPAIANLGQGGLLDVRVHPDFATNSWIYFTYAESVAGGATTALGRARLSGNSLNGFQKLISMHEPNGNDIHFGSRIEFDGQGHVFVSVGDRNVRERSQSLAYHTGKILRLNEDGSVPADNPFVGQGSARPEIWSYGHRNPQGLTREPGTGRIWSAEFGPRGGDEVNLIKPGKNYGWPVVTFGREYSGLPIGEGPSKPGMEPPVAHWVPSISPSGANFYSGDRFPRWRGNLFLANLSGQHLRRLVIRGETVVHQEALLKDTATRFRHVRAGPDGFLYYSTDDGRISRLVPEGP